jgi:hypothetical protein
MEVSDMIRRGSGADGRLQKAEEALSKMKIKRDQI